MNTFVFPIRIAVSWYLKIFYGVGTILFAGFTIGIWLSLHSLMLSFVPGLLAIFGIYAFLLSFTTIQEDEKSIIITAPHGVYKIDWSEITAIETKTIDDRRYESNDDVFAFIGENKHLAINLKFAGNSRAEFLEFIAKQIYKLKIEVKPLSSKWLSHKNTRIRRFGF